MYGILAGTAAALLMFMQNLSHGQFEILLNDKKEGVVGRISGVELDRIGATSDVLAYAIKGQLAYINSKAHLARFEELGLEGHQRIILRLRELYFIDRDGADALDEIIELCCKDGHQLAISGVSDDVAKVLKKHSDGYRKLLDDGLVFPGSKEALTHFGYDFGKHMARS